MAHFMTPLMMPFNGEKPTTDVHLKILRIIFSYRSIKF